MDRENNSNLVPTKHNSRAENMAYNGQLQKKALKFLNELKQVQTPRWKDKAFIEKAVSGYNKWLHLREKLKEHIAIPSDVKFVALVHMLHPLDYAQVIDLGENLDTLTNPPTQHQLDSLNSNWKSEFKEDSNASSRKKKLIPSVAAQIEFWPKLLSLGDERTLSSDTFLNKAVADYRKFLFLKKTAGLGPGAYLVPSMFVDLIWHTHMLYPEQYAADSYDLAGVILDHDDSITNHELTTHWKDTINAWEKQYGEILTHNNATDYVSTTPWHKQLTTYIANSNLDNRGASTCVGGGA